MSAHPVRRPRSSALFSALGFATLAAASPASASPSDAPVVSDVASFHWSNAIAAPRTVRLSGSNGGITVSPSADGKLDVRAVVKDGDPSRARVVTREEGGGVAVCVLFADESPEICHVGGVNRTGKGHHDEVPTIELVARVPAGVPVSANTLNGAIQAQVTGGEVHASTLNGNVTVSGGPVAEATTLNGSVDVTLPTAPSASVKFSTNNGNVTITLPRATNANLEASTMHGEIKAVVPMSIQSTAGGFGPKSGSGTLGSGGVTIEGRSLNGNVEFRTSG